jgi:uncharacterized membrane protein YsdA (DUF1294 family)
LSVATIQTYSVEVFAGEPRSNEVTAWWGEISCPRVKMRSDVQWLKLKLAIFLGLCALPGFGLVSMWLKGGSRLPALAYLLASVLAFALYARDKYQARNDGWRTPEKVLHAAELLGGWAGALLAQQVFRHKTRKASYQVLFWLIVLLHELFWLDRVLLGGTFISRHLY